MRRTPILHEGPASLRLPRNISPSTTAQSHPVVKKARKSWSTRLFETPNATIGKGLMRASGVPPSSRRLSMRFSGGPRVLVYGFSACTYPSNALPMMRGRLLIYTRENCAIEPSDIRMLRPGERWPTDESSKGKGKETEVDKTWKDLWTVRMVDCSLGLFLDEPVCDLISKAFRNIRDNEQSLNQSMSYIRHTPLLLDLELKKTNQARDPQVQLAIWLAAAYWKRKHHGWHTSIPMPGLVVNGHDWDFYIAFERDDGLVRSCRLLHENSTTDHCHRLDPDWP